MRPRTPQGSLLNQHSELKQVKLSGLRNEAIKIRKKIKNKKIAADPLVQNMWLWNLFVDSKEENENNTVPSLAEKGRIVFPAVSNPTGQFELDNKRGGGITFNGAPSNTTTTSPLFQQAIQAHSQSMDGFIPMILGGASGDYKYVIQQPTTYKSNIFTKNDEVYHEFYAPSCPIRNKLGDSNEVGSLNVAIYTLCKRISYPVTVNGTTTRHGYELIEIRTTPKAPIIEKALKGKLLNEEDFRPYVPELQRLENFEKAAAIFLTNSKAPLFSPSLSKNAKFHRVTGERLLKLANNLTRSAQRELRKKHDDKTYAALMTVIPAAENLMGAIKQDGFNNALNNFDDLIQNINAPKLKAAMSKFKEHIDFSHAHQNLAQAVHDQQTDKELHDSGLEVLKEVEKRTIKRPNIKNISLRTEVLTETAKAMRSPTTIDQTHYYQVIQKVDNEAPALKKLVVAMRNFFNRLITRQKSELAGQTIFHPTSLGASMAGITGKLKNGSKTGSPSDSPTESPTGSPRRSRIGQPV